ncbi:MAG: pyruvate dehydrogenase (acetyl-transferring) E1 component subunit alpha [Phycisphaerales bacterium]|nr:pyruvate dehydrogenase (acetyl-transferring) E1 component subunit alpha [Phycisphaerales bacterium]
MSSFPPTTIISKITPRGEIAAVTALKWLREMMLIREFELRCMQAYQDKKIGGFCHVYIGQEAVAVGTLAAIEASDPVVTAYRDHGHALARGMDPRHCMAEMFGRIGGCAKGKGGSMHMFDRANNLFGGHGIVGAQIPLGIGLAFATKYEDEVINGGTSKRVTLAYLGDGALNQGSVHEAKNLAGLFNLPVIIICENNGYSMGTAISRGTTMGHDIASKALGYGFEGVVMNGMDVLETYTAMKELVDRVRATSRPAFVDMRCYRYKGHSMSDPRKYRTREEEERYEADDPIGRLKAHLEGRNALTEDDFKAMQRDVRTQVRESVEWAEQSPPAPVSDLYRDVYRERWGPYTGSSDPEMLGGSENQAGFAATDPKADLL